MKKTYHLCLSADDEIMFRDLEDYHRGFNCFASALYKTDSTGLVESFMSTHTHQLVQTRCPSEFMYSFRQPYTMYFNNKYHRKGRLGEQHHFTMEVVGYHHAIAAASYTLRNALHHGVSPIPYAYPFCTANAIFSKEMGKFFEEPLLPESSYYRYIGRRCEYPDTYKMTASGVFTRESVLDIPQVEALFGTPRAFNFYMSRKSSEEWEAEQQKDSNNLASVNLEIIEKGVSLHDIARMHTFESGKADYRKTSDIELCTELDALARTRYGKQSVYELSLKEKEEIAEHLYRVRHLSESQIRRCLVLPKGR
ncbi:MAG: hypothetical protein IKY48_00825 [Bacteroidales bacterium]|nr:hypothetical protein [Bacteroidales bacterium]